MTPPRKPPEPGAFDREAVARMVDAAEAEIGALRRPRVKVRASGLITQLVNVAPDYDSAHMVAVNCFEPYFAAKTFCSLVGYRCAPDVVRCVLVAPIVLWRMN